MSHSAGRFDLFVAMRAAREARGLQPSSKLLLLVLLTYADEHGQCWPSLSRLASDTGLSLASIKTHKNKLQKLGVLCPVTRWRTSSAGQRCKTSNLYRVDLGALLRLVSPTEPSAPGEPVGQRTDPNPGEKHGVFGDPVGQPLAGGRPMVGLGWANGWPRVGQWLAPNSPSISPENKTKELSRVRARPRPVENPESEPAAPGPRSLLERLQKARSAVESLLGLLDGLTGTDRELVQRRLLRWQDQLAKLQAESARSRP